MTLRFTITFISVFFFSMGFSQMTRVQIDTLLFEETSKLRDGEDYKGVIELSRSIIKYAKQINYTNGVAWAYCHIGNSYSNLGNYKASLKNLEIAEKLAEPSRNYTLKASIAIEIGRNYNNQKSSFDFALKKFKEGEKYAKLIEKDYERNSMLLYSYESQSSVYYTKKQPDSAYYYNLMSFDIEKGLYETSMLIYHHVKITKNIDSIKYYIDFSDSLLNTRKEGFFEHAILFNLWGDYYFLIGNYKEAIKYYEKSLTYSNQKSAMEERVASFKNISKCYELLGNPSLSLQYIKQYTRLSDSISYAYIDEVGHSINNIVNREQKNLKIKEYNLRMIVLISVFGTIIVVSFFVYFYVRNSKIKSGIIVQSQELLSEKEKELVSIHKKVNSSFEQLVELAKSNHPNFYARFYEMYPEIQHKLLQINPDLIASELHLCSYIYLGFQTKEIADYWFKSIRTIQNRKNSLRKKLGISPQEDLYVWIKNI